MIQLTIPRQLQPRLQQQQQQQQRRRLLLPAIVAVLAPVRFPNVATVLSCRMDADSAENSSSDDISRRSNTTSVDSFVANGTGNVASSMNTKSSKADLYSNDELLGLFNVHQRLSETIPDFTLGSSIDDDNTLGAVGTNDSKNKNNMMSSLQDLIVQTIQDITDNNTSIEKERRPATTTAATIATIAETTTTEPLLQVPTNLSSLFRTKSFMNDQELIEKVRNVRAIVSDVDGTLIGKDQSVHPRTQQAIVNAIIATTTVAGLSTAVPSSTTVSSTNYNTNSSSNFKSLPEINDPNSNRPPPPSSALQHFFLATGKTRIGAMNSLGTQLQSILQDNPGVYVQGLYCIDGRTGHVIYEKKLTHHVIEQVESFIIQYQQQSNNYTNTNNITVLAYDGDVIYYNPIMSHTHHLADVSTKWGEPCPIPIQQGPSPRKPLSFTTYEPSFHKILLMVDDANIMSNILRPQLESALKSSSPSTELCDCVITQAIPTMLEVLPGGCSKAVGVQKLCEYYNIDLSTQVCAIGDAENDYDMIRLASIGIAVGDAIPSLKEVADIVMEDISTNGAAGYAIELFGLGKIES